MCLAFSASLHVNVQFQSVSDNIARWWHSMFLALLCIATTFMHVATNSMCSYCALCDGNSKSYRAIRVQFSIHLCTRIEQIIKASFRQKLPFIPLKHFFEIQSYSLKVFNTGPLVCLRDPCLPWSYWSLIVIHVFTLSC